MSPFRLFRVLASHATLVMVTAALVSVIILLAGSGAPSTHDAHALARLQPVPADAAAGGRTPTFPERAQALASERVLRAVTEELRLTADPGLRALRERRGDAAIPADVWLLGWLRQGMKIEATEGSPMVRVGFRAHDPVLAARIANALVSAPAGSAARAMPPAPPATAELRQRLAEAVDRLGRAQLEADVAAVDPAAGGPRAATDTARTKAISNQREQLAGLQRALDEAQRALDTLAKPAAAMPTPPDPRSALTVVAAAVPSGSAYTDLAVLVALSIGAGLLAGIVVALVIERTRRPVRDAADLMNAAGLPVLGSLCDASDTRRSRPSDAPASILPDPPVLTRIVPRSGRRGLAGDAGTA
jgi:uncharacterized protein involved in exopolysaccharide biosynthesis